MTGFGQCGAENAGADDAALFREDLEEVVIVAEAVYEGNGDGGVAHDGQRVLNCLLELSCLGHIDDDVDLALGLFRSGRAGVGAEALELIIIIGVSTVLFLMDGEVHAVLGYLLHVSLITVDEDHVCAALFEVRSKNAACCAGTIHCNFHFYSSPYKN